MIPSPDSSFELLTEIARSQNGFFTMRQAETLGYPPGCRKRKVKEGDWEQISDNLYRLPGFEAVPDYQFIEDYFSCNDRHGWPFGVLSHFSSLYLHGLIAKQPEYIYLTVPGKFLHKCAGNGRLILFRAALTPQDSHSINGLRCTTPVRTFSDLLMLRRADVVEELQEPLRMAKRKGLLTITDLNNSRCPQKVRSLLISLCNELS